MKQFLTDNFISLISLLVSVGTLVYTVWSSSLKLKITIPKVFHLHNDKDECEQYNYFFDCIIENRSNLPLTIVDIKLNNYSVFPESVLMKGWGITKFGTKIDKKIYSFYVPLPFQPFESKSGMLLFTSNKPIKLNTINLIKIHTTRGKAYKLYFYKKTD